MTTGTGKACGAGGSSSPASTGPTASLIAAGLVLLLAACAAPATERQARPPLRVQSAQDYGSAVRAAEATFSWPADRRPDIDKVIRDSQPPDGAMAQVGLETIVLSIVNACAWYLSWSDAVKRGEAGQAQRALEMLSGLPLAKIDPSTAQVVRQIAVSARAGDTAPAIGYAQANCDNVRWLEVR